MSRRPRSTVRQAPRIPRFFPKHAAGVSFAYVLGRLLIAAVSCGLVGGCVVTSAEEFPEELQVPPVVLNTTGFPIGSILTFNQMTGTDLRLGITVRDDNIDDILQVQAALSVVGQPIPEYVCPIPTIGTSGQPERDEFSLLIPRANIRAGACNRVDIYVSRDFSGDCTDTRGFGYPRVRGDIATALYWVWETSADPVSNQSAASDIVNTCAVVTPAGTPTPPPTMR
jgi:hypothetical protein